jgi:hypothetical protein
MAKEQAKKGIFERGSAFFERLHIAIGAVALAGAVALESATLGAVAVWEGAHAVFWNWAKKKSAKKQKLKPAPSH